MCSLRALWRTASATSTNKKPRSHAEENEKDANLMKHAFLDMERTMT